MLVVGLKGKGQITGSGLSFLEYQTHMSVWCMACSPLMIGCDIRKMNLETTSVLTNREVLGINQDAPGVPARWVRRYGAGKVWKKPLADGSLAIMLINRGSSGYKIPLKAGDVGLLDEPKQLRNLWSQKEIADFKAELTLRVQPHETMLLKVIK